MATYQGRILTKSPYYITEAVNSGATSNLEIRIWNGDFNTEPTAIDYNLSKQALSTSSTNVSFEIAKIIDDYISHSSTPYTNVGSENPDSLWVNIKSFGGDANRDDTWLVSDGYSNFLDGINYSPTDVVLISERILYHYDSFPLRLPVYCDGTSNANFVTFRKGTNEIFTESLVSYINSNNSYDKIQYVSLTGYSENEIDNIIIKNNVGATIDSLEIKPMNCNKYEPHIVSFINRFGYNQELIFSMKSRESLSITKKTYNRKTLTFNNGIPSYDTGKHVYKDYNANVRERITLNSDYIDESLNDTIAELISSENVWITTNGVTKPVNVTTKTLQYKSRVNDNLLQYSIDFEYAYDKRNNIY